MSDLQHRRHQLNLQLHADTLDDLWATMRMIANDMQFEGRETANVTSGGYSDGYHLTLTTDPDMTGAKYRAWLAAQR